MGSQSLLSLLCVLSCVLTALRAEDGVERRAPQMGFMGMRGKKDGFEDKRAPNMGFSAMRGKKDPLFDLSDLYLQELKRSPSMGFMGMRGKKEFLEPDLDFSQEFGYDKRAPSMGFAAMRGKKAPSGFMGMRGKKFDFSEDDVLEDDLWPVDEFEKRAPAAGFFGMRGKKMPQSSQFFGMRGKKGPSGFVGMRGKKGSEDLDSLLALLNERQGERSKREDSRVHSDATANSQGDPETVGSGSQ